MVPVDYSARHFYALPTAPPLLTLTLEQSPLRLLHQYWVGATDAPAVRAAGGAILQAVLDWRPVAILNDGGQGVGDWHELIPWLLFELLPQVRAAGVQAIAFLPPASASGQLAMHALTDEVPTGDIPLRLFTAEHEARAWLGTLFPHPRSTS